MTGYPVEGPVGIVGAGTTGAGTVLRILDSLDNWYRDGRYRASPLLRRAALSARFPETEEDQ